MQTHSLKIMHTQTYAYSYTSPYKDTKTYSCKLMHFHKPIPTNSQLPRHSLHQCTPMTVGAVTSWLAYQSTFTFPWDSPLYLNQRRRLMRAPPFPGAISSPLKDWDFSGLRAKQLNVEHRVFNEKTKQNRTRETCCPPFQPQKVAGGPAVVDSLDTPGRTRDSFD